MELSPQERAEIEAFEARASERAHFPVTLEKLLSWWERFVEEVEQGYPSSFDEYTNDLSTRDALERLVREASPELAAKLTRKLEPLDERFRAATQDDAGRMAELSGPGEGWWWSRLPTRLEGELREALEA